MMTKNFCKQPSIMLLAILLGTAACKKEQDGPVNSASPSLVDCETCPSVFHEFIELPIATTTCDDFTTYVWAPSGDTLGNSQGGVHSIINVPYFGTGGLGIWDLGGVSPGMFGINAGSRFDFDGSTQTVAFEVYGFYSQYNLMGFSVNGSANVTLDGNFPMTINGIMVDLDTSIADIAPFEHALLTLTGNINDIELYAFESGIVNLCVTPIYEGGPQDVNSSVYFDSFIGASGQILGNYPNFKTPLGFYSISPTSLTIDFNAFLGYEPTKISFVHAFFDGNTSQIVNVKLPNAPLIVTTPDSLQDYLAPYGYQVNHYSDLNATIWQDQNSAPINGVRSDSIIIEGSGLGKITIGAHLFESELRSICTFHE